MKYYFVCIERIRGVAPRAGGRGLKLLNEPVYKPFRGRPPRRGAWIEICVIQRLNCFASGRPPRRGAWIEIKRVGSS